MKTRYLLILPLLALLAVVACRRDVWLYSDNFHTIRLEADWSDYDENTPGGMTVWFYPAEKGGQYYTYTTDEVFYPDFYLAGGTYHGVICDYSPQEFSTVEFLDMDNYQKARVQLTEKGNQPEPIALDTLQNMVIHSGPYAEYIPYEDRDDYQQSLKIQRFQVKPRSLVWKMRLRIYVKGVEYLYQVRATLEGLALGHYLARDINTERSCVVTIDNWELQHAEGNDGYIAATISTFGLPYGYEEHADNLKLNLTLLLRDRTTVRSYAFELGDQVVSMAHQQVLRIDVDNEEIPGLPDLPYVEAYDGTGFDGVVTPWDDSDPPKDVVM